MTDAEISQLQQTETAKVQDKSLKIKRKKGLILVAIVVMIGLVLYMIWAILLNHSVSTDNAYVGAETASITSMVTGQVSEVLVSDTEQVRAGQVLAKIDRRDAEIALTQANAELMKAKRMFKQSKANSGALNSQIYVSDDQITSAQAKVNQAQAELTKAQSDFTRRQQLSASGAISKEEFSTSQTALQNAKAGLEVAQAGLAQAKSNQKAAHSNLDANEALIQGTSENTAPDVLVAESRVKQANLDLERTEIKAPFDGVVTRRNIQIGQRVSPGSVMMMVVPIHKLYVDANFKESQLKRVRIGQKVKLKSDLYGDDVEYSGTVVGFSGGTGAAFALIPAQNATGNWIKVVQRLPVRIQLDPQELKDHPLRVGLSMDATIDLKSK